MHTYLKWHERVISDFSDKHINALYNQGYIFGRTGKGEMYQTRSLRINLEQFELSSENRRVLKKTEEINIEIEPLPYTHYDWTIAKMGKDFYTAKFGDGTFSANKIKELMTDSEKSNFNMLFVYTCHPERSEGSLNADERDSSVAVPLLQNDSGATQAPIGYCIALETNELIHYCYPFYQLQTTNYKLPPNTGLGMMVRAILYAKAQGKKYIYLGSAQRPSDTYKLQFTGVEWFNGKEWKSGLNEVKNILAEKL